MPGLPDLRSQQGCPHSLRHGQLQWGCGKGSPDSSRQREQVHPMPYCCQRGNTCEGSPLLHGSCTSCHIGSKFPHYADCEGSPTFSFVSKQTVVSTNRGCQDASNDLMFLTRGSTVTMHADRNSQYLMPKVTLRDLPAQTQWCALLAGVAC